MDIQDVEWVQVMAVKATTQIPGVNTRPPNRRQKHNGLANVEVTSTLAKKAMRGPAPQPADPTAQLELLLPIESLMV